MWLGRRLMRLTAHGCQRRAAHVGGIPALTHRDLPHGGIQIDIGASGIRSAAEFEETVRPALQNWRDAGGKKAVWLHLHGPAQCQLVPAALDLGFAFHHAKGEALAMYQWLPEKTEDKVPPFATHQVGCAGWVVNNKSEILLVREPGSLETWKLPGGIASLGEDFGEAAEREVMEECGVASRFEDVLAFRHQHGLTFSKSDIYVVCHLSPVDENAVPLPDQEEVIDAQWIPLDDFAATTTHPLMLECIAVFEGKRRIVEKKARFSEKHPWYKLYTPAAIATGP